MSEFLADAEAVVFAVGGFGGDRHFNMALFSTGEMILVCVRWYLRYPLAYEHVAERLAERGVEVDPSCIWRWVQAYAPELNKRCRPHLKPTNKSYRTDETYIKVKGEDKYLYRAVVCC